MMCGIDNGESSLLRRCEGGMTFITFNCHYQGSKIDPRRSLAKALNVTHYSLRAIYSSQPYQFEPLMIRYSSVGGARYGFAFSYLGLRHTSIYPNAAPAF